MPFFASLVSTLRSVMGGRGSGTGRQTERGEGEAASIPIVICSDTDGLSRVRVSRLTRTRLATRCTGQPRAFTRDILVTPWR